MHFLHNSPPSIQDVHFFYIICSSDGACVPTFLNKNKVIYLSKYLFFNPQFSYKKNYKMYIFPHVNFLQHVPSCDLSCLNNRSDRDECLVCPTCTCGGGLAASHTLFIYFPYLIYYTI